MNKPLQDAARDDALRIATRYVCEMPDEVAEVGSLLARSVVNGNRVRLTGERLRIASYLYTLGFFTALHATEDAK